MGRDVVLRSARDLGLAVWLGGSLMGAVGLNGTAARAVDRVAAAEITSSGWSRWTPVGAAAIALHLAGAVGSAGRLRRPGSTAAVTAAAMAASTYSYVVGKQIQHAALDPPRVATEAELGADRRARLLRAERGLGRVQWVVPTLTSALIVLHARADGRAQPQSARRATAAKSLDGPRQRP
jgi:hypothetical protein